MTLWSGRIICPATGWRRSEMPVTARLMRAQVAMSS